MKKTFSCVLVLFLCAVIFIVACEADPTLVPSTVAAPTRQAPTAPLSTRATSAVPVSPVPTARRGPGGSIVIAGVGEPSRELTTLPEFVSSALYDSLLRVDPRTGDLIPGLAERWLVSDDAKTFVFFLREGVKWHDGTPLTADDVVFSLKALSDPDIRITPAADFGSIAGVKAMDARTVSVTLKEPYCAALTYIGTVGILPKHVLEGEDFGNLTNEDLIGTGPLVLQEWDKETLTFARNAAYWNGAPQIVNWTYQSFPTEAAAREAVQQGQADLLIGNPGDQDAASTAIPANEFYGLALNSGRAPFDDVKTRQAIASAVDISQFTATFAGTTTLETSLLPAFWATPRSVTQPPFDPSRARRLLSEVGWKDSNGDGILEKDGNAFEVTLWAQAEEPKSEIAAQLVRKQLEQVGVRAVLKLTDRTLFLTRLFLHEYDLALAHMNIPLDPDQHFFWASSENDPGYGLNVTGFTNKSMDEALDKGNQVARCDPTARKNAYAPVFQQIAQNVPMVFLFAPARAVNTNSDLFEIAPSSFAGGYWNLNKWEVGQ